MRIAVAIPSSHDVSKVTVSARIAVRFAPHVLVSAIVANAISGVSNPLWPAAWLFLCAPLVELAVGEEAGHHRSASERAACRLAAWTWLPLHAGLLTACLWVVHSAGSFAAAASLGLSAGMVCGVFGMSAAHELLHVRTRPAQCAAAALLASCGYGHFLIEHVQGHHRRVGTAVDPATARLGESLYGFLPRSIIGGFAGAWRFESERLAQRGRGWLTRHNRALLLGLVSILLCAMAGLFAGAPGVLFFVLQSVVGVMILESMNYIQHYGLARPRRSPITAALAWDCRFRLTNLLLLDLGRHPDHHMRPARSAGEAVLDDRSPRLPAGYFLMFLLALVPPLWARFMDPRVALLRAQQATEPQALP